jgi:hypothetical protein
MVELRKRKEKEPKTAEKEEPTKEIQQSEKVRGLGRIQVAGYH